MFYHFYKMINQSEVPIVFYYEDDEIIDPITLYTPENGWIENISEYFGYNIEVNVWADEISVFKA